MKNMHKARLPEPLRRKRGPLLRSNRGVAMRDRPAPRRWATLFTGRRFPQLGPTTERRPTRPRGRASGSAPGRELRFRPSDGRGPGLVPEAAMCVRKISAQGVLQFTPSLAAGCVLHRPASRVIHCSELSKDCVRKGNKGNHGWTAGGCSPAETRPRGRLVLSRFR